MANDDTYQDQPEAPAHTEELPDRLRVHTLARVLGTTSRRVLEALSDLDGRSRSAHSSVDRTDAVRVRDVLAAQPSDAAPAGAEPVESAPAAAEPELVIAEAAVVEVAVAEPDTADSASEVLFEGFEGAVSAEPESRLMLETPEPAADPGDQADYLPLFVAPQPVDTDSDADQDSDDDSEDGDDDGTDADSDLDPDDDDQAERPANRRRRRGRRGRGRGRGADGTGDDDADSDQVAKDQPAKAPKSTNDDKSDGSADGDDSADDAGDDDNGDDDAGGADGATRRRRRRRRRKSGSGDDGDSTGSGPDDPPNTVVHERAPRSKADKGRDNNEIQGISGSTRLEAKRQRRRDGRDAGRRRPPILSEAEFLARREAVERVMVVRDKVRTEPPHEAARYTQIAVLEDGVVVEHFVTSAASASLVGNIYLGIVQNVLPSMEAAFVDIGRGRNGVLYAGEVNWEAAGLGGAARKIEQALKPGDFVVVQVSKDPVGHKGARLTTQVSLAGRYLVYVPGASSTGISRKLPDTERQRLKEILREVVPSDAGVIIRTASEGVKEEDIRGDVTRLQERWEQIDAVAAQTKAKAAGAAVALYEEPDVLVKVIRDLFNEDFSGLIVSGDDAWSTINDYVSSLAPELVPKLTKFAPPTGQDQQGPDVFAVYRIDEQLAKAMDRKVWLPSGGSLVIDRTEAMTVVDVNTGKFTGAGGNLEQTVTKNNLEAAEEVVRQLRLRDIGGIVVIDFIDMVLESNRDLVLRRLTEALGRDRTRHQVSEVTSLGLVQLTRKKLGTGLIEAFSTTCPHCAGRGIMLHADPVDTAAGAPARSGKAEPARRSKRSKRGRAEEPAEVAKVPPHVVGEHPMFKAMAAANGKHEDGTDIEDDGFANGALESGAGEADVVANGQLDDTAEQVAVEVAEEDLDEEDLDEEDFDDSDDDSDDPESDELDVDLDDADDDDDDDSDDDDIELVQDSDEDDSEDDDSDDDDSEDDPDDDDSDDDDSDDVFERPNYLTQHLADLNGSEPEEGALDFEGHRAVVVAAVSEPGSRPRRRRAAARPAGPPV